MSFYLHILIDEIDNARYQLYLRLLLVSDITPLRHRGHRSSISHCGGWCASRPIQTKETHNLSFRDAALARGWFRTKQIYARRRIVGTITSCIFAIQKMQRNSFDAILSDQSIE